MGITPTQVFVERWKKRENRLDERTAKKGRKRGRKKVLVEKKYKNTLDKKMASNRYSHRASKLPSPCENVPTFLSYPHAGK